MFYVYLLQSIDHPKQIYTGLTEDLPERLRAHNEGRSTHTPTSSSRGGASSHFDLSLRSRPASSRPT